MILMFHHNGKMIACACGIPYRSIMLRGLLPNIETPFFSLIQLRFMTKSRNVQDRSKKKRVFYLERATERWKIASKVIFLMELLRNEPEQVMPVKILEQYRQKVNITKPHKIGDFARKSPRLFELYKDSKGRMWCGLTREAEELMQEEGKLLEEHSGKAAEYVTRFLMMSADKKLPVDKIAHFRRDIGLPLDFRTRWIHCYPEHFRVIKIDDSEFLELVSWNPELAVTELERKRETRSEASVAGMLDLSFPLKFPPNYKKIFRIGGSLEHFQELEYLSPYAEAQELIPGTPEFDKRAVSVMHEILSFTLEKRVVTDHLTHFRREFTMPQKLMRLLLKHFGIFYVSERGKRVHVFLTEAYEGSELIEKCPLVRWKEKVLSLTGYRGRRKNIGQFDEFSGDEIDDEMDMKDGLFDESATMEIPGIHDKMGDEVELSS